MKTRFGIYFFVGFFLCVSFADAETITKDVDLSFSSPLLIQQGDVRVTLADFVAYLDWRIPPEDQRDVLANPARIEGILESIVLMEAFVYYLDRVRAMEDPFVKASLYSAVTRQARSIYRDQVIKDIELDSYEKQARELYMLEPEKFMTPESLNFKHILVSTSQGLAPVEAMRHALEAHDALINGQAFSKVAEEFSDDPGFEDHRGEFKNVPIEALVPPVSAGIQELDLNEWSSPIQSQFGWHIVQVTGVNDSKQMTWEEAKPLAQEIAREKHLSRAYERQLREINSAPMQFADGAVKRILDHYGLQGFDVTEPQSEKRGEADSTILGR